MIGKFLLLWVLLFGSSVATLSRGANLQDLPATLETIDGQVHSRAALSEGVVVLNFWFMACFPCLKELPDLEKLSKYKPSNQKIKYIAISPYDDVEQLSYFKRRRDFGFELASDQLFPKHFHITTYPTTIVLRNGKPVYRSEGYNANLYKDILAHLE